MISRLFKKKLPVSAPRSATVPQGTVVWAVGDIHGRLDLLEPLVATMVADVTASAADRTIIVFLGDYIDRGPASRQVIRYLCDLPNDLGIQWRFLKGNHEEAMMDFLRDPTTGPTWCDYGGDATLASYGLRLPQLKHRPEPWAHLSADLDHKMLPAERAFLEGLELSVSVGDYFFSHAGARPGVNLDEQSSRDLLWIRDSFLMSAVEFHKIIVHGHTPVDSVHADHRRIGIDTKAYASGVLTALRLSGSTRALRQTSISPDGAVSVDVLELNTSVSQLVSHP